MNSNAANVGREHVVDIIQMTFFGVNGPFDLRYTFLALVDHASACSLEATALSMRLTKLQHSLYVKGYVQVEFKVRLQRPRTHEVPTTPVLATSYNKGTA